MKKLNNLIIIVVTTISYVIALTYLKEKLYVDFFKNNINTSCNVNT